jgi:hypothetical protein
MSTVSTVHGFTSTLNDLAQEVYSDKVKDLVPSATKLTQMIKFQEAGQKLGKEYVHPVLLTLENGFTYGGADGEAFQLNDAATSQVKSARVKGHEMVLRSAMSIKSITATDANSFEKSTKFIIGNMLKSMYHRLEIQLMYGQSGLGVVKEDAAAGTDILEIKESEWASAIWNGSENAMLDIKRGASHIATVKIKSISQKNKTIRTVSALPVNVLADDVLSFEGSSSTEFKGLHAIATTSGDLFGIDNNVYDLFKANEVEVGTALAPAILTFEKIQEGVAVAMEKGFGEESMTVIVNPKSWKNLLTEQASLRQYDSSFSKVKVEQGAQYIEFYSQNGMIKIVPSTFCKEGYAYAICEKDMMRIGSIDVSFKDPMTGEEKYFRHLEDRHGVEMRAYTDQALFCPRPSSIVLFKYIKSEASA